MSLYFSKPGLLVTHVCDSQNREPCTFKTSNVNEPVTECCTLMRYTVPNLNVLISLKHNILLPAL